VRKTLKASGYYGDAGEEGEYVTVHDAQTVAIFKEKNGSCR